MPIFYHPKSMHLLRKDTEKERIQEHNFSDSFKKTIILCKVKGK